VLEWVASKMASIVSGIARALGRRPAQEVTEAPGPPPPPGPNLALGQVATQSSASPWSSSAKPDEDARGANNGRTDGSQGCHTGLDQFPWWQVDLGTICRLSEVRLYNRRLNPERLRRFSVLTSLDGARWVEAYRKADSRIFGLDGAPYVAGLSEGSFGRFVRIQCNEKQYLHLCECQVFGAAAAPSEEKEFEAKFHVRLEAETRRMSWPLDSISPEDIDVELALSQAIFPFPAREIWRTTAREWILEYATPGGVGAEVGVFRGHFTEAILRTLAPDKFYLVDPWRKLGQSFSFSMGGDYSNRGQLPTALARRDAELRARKFPATRTVVIEDFFPQCAAQISEPLDWIYIDSSHLYEPTLVDLAGAAKLIKPNGRILGDDYWPLHPDPPHGVARALKTFLSTEPFQMLAAGPQGQWCIRRLSA
jgi:hypothetical protein